MKTIHKFPFVVRDKQKIQMPAGAEVNHCGLDPNGQPCLWAIVDSGAPHEDVDVIVVGTGMVIPEDVIFLGSFLQDKFVWHVFIQP